MKDALIATGIGVAGLLAVVALTVGLFAIGGWIGTLLGADDFSLGGLIAITVVLCIYLVVIIAAMVYNYRTSWRK